MRYGTDILQVKNISFEIIKIYRELWGDMTLEHVQIVYLTNGLDNTQKPTEALQ